MPGIFFFFIVMSDVITKTRGKKTFMIILHQLHAEVVVCVKEFYAFRCRFKA